MSFNPNFFSVSNNVYTPDRYTQVERSQKVRSEFSRDRDRIMYTKSFRRLSGKTQIFLSNTEEDIRSRLTHTLEVNQIAKTIALALGHNVELVEAIALGHDIGHTPFGHVGERTLNHIMNQCINMGVDINDDNKGFKHNLQALRILCELENIDGHNGLNLSKYTLWGIANHSNLSYKECKVNDLTHCYETYICRECLINKQPSCQYYNHFLENLQNYWSFEGWIVAIADEIAQRHHDIEDGLRYNIIDRNEILERLEPFKTNFSNDDKRNMNDLLRARGTDIEEFLRLFSRFIVHYYVCNVIKTTKEHLRDLFRDNQISKTENFKDIRGDQDLDVMKGIVSFSERTKEEDGHFHDYLKERILGSYMAQSMDGKGQYIIRKLFAAYMSDPCQLPDSVIKQFYQDINVQETSRFAVKNNISGNENILMRVICDYIGGMTDSYAYRQFDILYGTRVR